MSVKKVNLHVSSEIHNAISILSKANGVSMSNFIEEQKKIIKDGNDKNLSSLILSSSVKSTSHSKRHTIKVLDTTRSFIKELSEKHNVPMSVVVGAIIYKTTGDKTLGNYLNLKEGSNKETVKEDTHISLLNPKDKFCKKSDAREIKKAREKARSRGQHYQNVSNMSVDEIHSLAKNGDKRAQEIIKRRDQILAKEADYNKKKKEDRRLAEENKRIKQKNDSLINLLKNEANTIKKQKEDAANIKTVIKEVLVKDVDFHEEKKDLDIIRDKLDELIGKVDTIRPNSTNTSYQIVNEVKRNINTVFIILNRYCSLRTRIYLREEKEKMETTS